jgi:hypothetical protein
MIEEGSGRMDMALGGHEYRIYELYCTDPKCECWDVYLAFFKAGEGEQSFGFHLSLEDFKVNPKAELEEEAEGRMETIGAFLSIMGDAQRNMLVAHYRKAKEYGRKDPSSYLDVFNFEFGAMLPYSDFFGFSRGEPFNFVYRGKWHHIEDLYCVTPSCNCQAVILSVYEAEEGNEAQNSLFDILVGFNGRFEIRRKSRELSKRRVKRFFREAIKGNEGLFGALRERYARMKTLGAQVLARRIDELEKQEKRISKNSPCPCGSGKKYKLCCARAVEEVLA